MRIALAADHAGFELKERLRAELTAEGLSVEDLGAHTYDALDDYPDFARLVAERVAVEEGLRGILVCGSGIGASIAANKVPGVRASIAPDTYSARQGVEHDDMNVLVLGARTMGIEVVREVVRSFLAAKFSGEERHRRRLTKVEEIERAYQARGEKGE